MLPKIKTILYATGFGAGVPHVFRYALTMANQHDAHIVAVSAFETLSEFAQNLVAPYIPADQRKKIHDEAHQSSKKKLQEPDHPPLRKRM
jgi:lactam utilization protein B